ncbi:MAG: trimethylamine methyltransferase family protein [Anaerolineae bacterium]|nr:trimethylamine methyltransferase family protein [Anaerolineae bacterium]
MENALVVRHTMEIVRMVFGSDPGDEPATLGVISSLTPLRYSREMAGALVAYAREGQALLVANLAMAGTTAPITLAGMLAMQNAEMLAGIVLSQLVKPGTPVIYEATSTNVDMRTGALVIGSPDLAQVAAAHMQLVRYYGLLSRGSGALTDANYPSSWWIADTPGARCGWSGGSGSSRRIGSRTGLGLQTVIASIGGLAERRADLYRRGTERTDEHLTRLHDEEDIPRR